MIHDITRRLREPRPVTVATVLRAVGSTPQVAGCKALIEPDGTIAGTLGGGMLEAESQRRAAGICQSGGVHVFHFAMDAAYARDAGPICGGTMTIMLDARREALRPAYEAASQALAEKRGGILMTSLDPATAPTWIDADDIDTAPSLLADAMRSAIDHEAPVYVDEERPVFIEPVLPPPRLLVVGAGHVGQAVANLAHNVGFSVTVVDDRPEFTVPERFAEGVSAHHGVIQDMVKGFGIDLATYVVLVSKGHKPDAEALEMCIDSPAKYLGMIGSRRKILEIKTDFLRRGLATEDSWARIHAPIGLDIGAITVPEIAVSIVAELIAARRVKTPDAAGALAAS